jgi:hypothetical protein
MLRAYNTKKIIKFLRYGKNLEGRESAGIYYIDSDRRNTLAITLDILEKHWELM